MHRLQGKSAIITGAASGIGAGTAELFAEEGARLVLVDRDEVHLTSVTSRLQATGADVVSVVGDVSAKETAARAMATALTQFGQLDILFNNAGIMTSGDFQQVDEVAWDTLLDINLRGI